MNRDAVIFFAVLLLVAFCGFAVRFHFALEPLWIDELHTKWSTDIATTLCEMTQRAGQGNQTPLYFTLVWLVQKLFGFSAIGLRAISLSASLFSILVVGTLVRTWTKSSTCGLLSAAVLAADYWCIFYGSEARPYALVQLLAVCQSAAFCSELKLYAELKSSVPAKRIPGRINTLLTVFTTALMLTHLTCILLVASQIIVSLLLFRFFNIQRIGNSFAIAILALVVCAPVLSHVLTIRSDWAGLNQIGSFAATVRPILVTYLTAPLLMVTTIWLVGIKLNKTSLPVSLVFIGSALLPLLLAITLQIMEIAPVASFRYISYLPLLLAVSMGLIVATIQNKTWRVAASMTLFAIAIFLNPLTQKITKLNDIRFRRENWQEAIAKINQLDIGEQTLVFLFANLVEDHRLQEITSTEFKDYLRFPLQCGYPMPSTAQTIPMPTITTNLRWTKEHVQLIQLNGGCHLIARTDNQLFQQIIDELTLQAQSLAIPLEIRKYEQDRNVVRVATVTPVPNQINPIVPD